MDEKIIRYVEFPLTVRAVTCLDHNGDYNIYINMALSEEARAEAFAHELRHIEKEHFYNEIKPINECEEEANGKR